MRDRWTEYVQNQPEEFVRGVSDCASFAAGWAEIIGGKKPFDAVLGAEVPDNIAEGILEMHGGMCALVRSLLLEMHWREETVPVDYSIAVASYKGGFMGEITGVIIGGNLVTKCERGGLLFAAGALATSLFTPEQGGSGQKRGKTQNVRSSTFPHQAVYGRVRKGGMIFYLNGTGDNNDFLHIGIVYCSHEVQGIEDYYFDGEITIVDTLGNPLGTLKDYARLQYRLGVPSQSALADMVAENSNWTTSHTLSERTYVYARLKYSNDKFPSFIPTITAVIEGQLDIYDPRNGGSSYTDNPALIVADILHRYLDIPYARIHQASLIEAADICDETVYRADGTPEKRYRAGGYFDIEGDPEEWLTPFIQSMAGFCAEFGGTYYIHAGSWRTPEITITDDDIVGRISYTTAQSNYSRSNAVKGIFVSPEVSHDQETDYPAIINSDYVTEDGGIINFLEQDLDKVPSHTQAQRVASIYLEQNREDEVLSIETNLLKGLDIKPFDTVIIQSDALGVSGTFRVIDHSINIMSDDGNPSLNVPLTLKKHTSDVYAWDALTQESSMVNVSGESVSYSPDLPTTAKQIPSWNGSSIPFYDPGQLGLSWNDPTGDVLELEIELEITYESKLVTIGLGGGSSWVDRSVVKSYSIPVGVEVLTENLADLSTNPLGWEYRNFQVVTARIRSKINSSPTYSNWVNFTP